MVSFNDTHVFRMDKALESVIYYTKWNILSYILHIY